MDPPFRIGGGISDSPRGKGGDLGQLRPQSISLWGKGTLFYLPLDSKQAYSFSEKLKEGALRFDSGIISSTEGEFLLQEVPHSCGGD